MTQGLIADVDCAWIATDNSVTMGEWSSERRRPARAGES